MPFPSWPSVLRPQARTVPSAKRARVCWPPAEIATGLFCKIQPSTGPAVDSAKVTWARLEAAPALTFTRLKTAEARGNRTWAAAVPSFSVFRLREGAQGPLVEEDSMLPPSVTVKVTGKLDRSTPSALATWRISGCGKTVPGEPDW